jgi:exosortase A
MEPLPMAVPETAASVAQHGDIGPGGETRPITPSLRRRRLSVALAVVVLLVGVLALYWKTTLSMVAIWERSETFAHGFLVFPIFCYLLWRRRDALAGLEPRPYLGALLGIAAAGAAWLLGEIVSAASVSQFAMVAMVPLAVWAVLGTRIAMALVIPLAFLFFAVPLGEFLVPTLIDWTANFTVAALRASGIPVYREGNYFYIPSGAWSVVEACSGLRYLIASLMVGCLYAYLSYRSPIRRAVFIAASLIVPIVANWLRAYMIVMIGHLSSNRLAVGVDHLIYGWLFFGVVIGLLFWIGSRWREDDAPVSAGAIRPSATDIDANARPAHRIWTAALAAVVLMVIWQPLRAHLDPSGNATTVRLEQLTGRGGWVAVPDSFSAWRPDVSGARAELRQTFARGGERVGLYVAFYRGQTQETKAITSSNQLVVPKNAVWRLAGVRQLAADVGGEVLDVRAGVAASHQQRLAVWQWYWADGAVTSSDVAAKLYQALSVLRGHGDPVAWVVVYTPTDTGEPQVRAALQAFTADMRAPIDALLRQAASQ